MFVKKNVLTAARCSRTPPPRSSRRIGREMESGRLAATMRANPSPTTITYESRVAASAAGTPPFQTPTASATRTMPMVVPAACAKFRRFRSPRTISNELPFSIHSRNGSPAKAMTSTAGAMCWKMRPCVRRCIAAAIVQPRSVVAAVRAMTLPATTGSNRARSCPPRR